jgi:hypothetical protein
MLSHRIVPLTAFVAAVAIFSGCASQVSNSTYVPPVRAVMLIPQRCRTHSMRHGPSWLGRHLVLSRIAPHRRGWKNLCLRVIVRTGPVV